MRLHTNLTAIEVQRAFYKAIADGKIAPDVTMPVFQAYRSQTHKLGIEIQLGTDQKGSLPAGYRDQHGKKLRYRRTRNGTRYSDEIRFAATWHEWGWLIAYVFEADPASRWGSNPAAKYPWGYFSPEDFREKTNHQFVLDQPAMTAIVGTPLHHHGEFR